MTARMTYTRWQRDRGGKLRLSTSTYRIIGEEAPFPLVRRRHEWVETTCEAIGAVLLVGVAALVVSAAFGCSGPVDQNTTGRASADEIAPPPEQPSPEARPTLSDVVLTSSKAAPVAIVAPQKTMLLDPADEVLELTLAAAETFREHGFAVEIGTGGIPVDVSATVTDRGGMVDSRARYDGWCYYYGCNALASIELSRVMLETKPQIAQRTLEHELAHIISGWGACVQKTDALPMADAIHLTVGHLVSNGNTHYESVQWTAEDSELMHTCIVAGGNNGS